MSTENSTSKFKIIIGILAFLLVSIGIYTVSLYNNSKEKTDDLTEEKQDIENELRLLIVDYDQVIQDNDVMDNDLLAAKQRIEVLLDSVKDSESNVALIKRYKIELGRLKNERKILFRKADSLIVVNQSLTLERDSTQVVLNETYRVVDSVEVKNIALAETIKRGAVVKVSDLSAEAVIERASGKIVNTRRSKRADKIRACFSLTENAIAVAGDRLLLIQVINPVNNVIGERATMNFADEGTLLYSATTKVFYENEELDVCLLVSTAEADLIEGMYTINVFDGSHQVATTTMTLK